jgi:predicted cupin superfamily sugar epimerase
MDSVSQPTPTSTAVVGARTAGGPWRPNPEDMGMQPHPEGGWYRETWRHSSVTPTDRGERRLATCVAFLLLPGERSSWHRVASEELWLWQGGGPLLLTVGGFDDSPLPGFSCELSIGGQYLVRANEWQSAEPATDDAVLVACVVSPGFEFADFTLVGD